MDPLGEKMCWYIRPQIEEPLHRKYQISISFKNQNVRLSIFLTSALIPSSDKLI